MVIKVFISGMSGNKEVKKRQQRVLMILDSKNIKYECVDITEPGKETDREFMQTNSTSNGATIGDQNPRHPLPPQIFAEGEYCGDYDAFDLANEIDQLEVFCKIESPSEKISSAQIELKKENGEIATKVDAAAADAVVAEENDGDVKNKEETTKDEEIKEIDEKDNSEKKTENEDAEQNDLKNEDDKEKIEENDTKEKAEGNDAKEKSEGNKNKNLSEDSIIDEETKKDVEIKKDEETKKEEKSADKGTKKSDENENEETTVMDEEENNENIKIDEENKDNEKIGTPENNIVGENDTKKSEENETKEISVTDENIKEIGSSKTAEVENIELAHKENNEKITVPKIDEEIEDNEKTGTPENNIVHENDIKKNKENETEEISGTDENKKEIESTKIPGDENKELDHKDLVDNSELKNVETVSTGEIDDQLKEQNLKETDDKSVEKPRSENEKTTNISNEEKDEIKEKSLSTANEERETLVRNDDEMVEEKGKLLNINVTDSDTTKDQEKSEETQGIDDKKENLDKTDDESKEKSDDEVIAVDNDVSKNELELTELKNETEIANNESLDKSVDDVTISTETQKETHSATEAESIVPENDEGAHAEENGTKKEKSDEKENEIE